MWLDLLALLVLAVFALVGMLRGTLRSALALLALVGAYAGAWLATPHLAPALSEQLGIARMIALPLAGTLAFVGGFAGVSVLALLLRRLERRGRRKAPRGGADRFGGAVFGTARGFVIVLLLGWLALWLDGLREVGGAAWAPEAEASLVSRASQAVVERGVEAALGEDAPGGRAAARAAARPAQAIRRFESLLENERIGALRDDGIFWTHVESGNVDAALSRLSFQAIAYDDGLRAELAALGLVEPAAASGPVTFRSEAEEVLRAVGPRLRGLRRDPEMRRLVEDPEVQRMLAEGDTIGLLRHRGFHRLVDRVLAEPAPAPGAAPGGTRQVRNYRD